MFSRLSLDVEMMVGFRPSYFFMFCWRFAGPTAMVVIFAASLVEMFSKGTWYEIWDADKVWIILLLINKYVLYTYLMK